MRTLVKARLPAARHPGDRGRPGDAYRGIAEILEETRRAFDRAGADVNSGDSLAASLSADVSGLKLHRGCRTENAKPSTPVQGTLEAVVKRMAFLEREAETGAAVGDRRPVEAPKLAAPAKAPKLPEAAPARGACAGVSLQAARRTG
jgi:hypothetical protein